MLKDQIKVKDHQSRFQTVSYNSIMRAYHSKNILTREPSNLIYSILKDQIKVEHHHGFHKDKNNTKLVKKIRKIMQNDVKNNYREYLFQQFKNSSLVLLPFQTTRILLLRGASLSQNYDAIAILIYMKIMAMSSL